MIIQINGNPIPYARVRVTRFGAYNPLGDKKKAIMTHLLSLRILKLTGPLNVKLTFDVPIPKWTSNKKQKQMINHIVVPSKRPDLDNFIKFILDCANGILFDDDSQIVSIKARKRYSELPSTIIEINQWKEKED